MVITIILLLIGFALLIKGSDLFVDGSSSIAQLMGIPSLIVGLTIVSMGTSAPEAAVSITAGFKGSNEIAISNLIGSNIFNMLCVAGLSAAITPFAIGSTVLKRDFPVCLGIMVITALMGLDGIISRLDALLLLVIFVAYMIVLVVNAKKSNEQSENEKEPMPLFKSIIFMLIGIAAIIGGGQLTVQSAQKIALALGMSETLIGVTIIAIGTSLPELVTSAIAAKKGESGIAIGNVLGSSIFNLAFVLGMSAAANPVGVVPEAMIDACVMIAVNALGFIFCLSKKKLSRAEGLCLLGIYVVYTIYLIMR